MFFLYYKRLFRLQGFCLNRCSFSFYKIKVMVQKLLCSSFMGDHGGTQKFWSSGLVKCQMKRK